MTVTCCIRYTLDPYRLDEFEAYARNWLTILGLRRRAPGLFHAA